MTLSSLLLSTKELIKIIITTTTDASAAVSNTIKENP